MNIRLIQSELDRVASELDSKGMRSLADEVDWYNDKLVKATSEEEIRIIGRALARINNEITDNEHGREPHREREPHRHQDRPERYSRRFPRTPPRSSRYEDEDSRFSRSSRYEDEDSRFSRSSRFSLRDARRNRLSRS